MSVRIYRPDGAVDTTVTRLADPLPTLAGRRIVVLDNGKPNAAVLMTHAAETLATRTGATLALVLKKGPGGRSANAAIPCAPDVFARVRDVADLVITGAADCGSCTAYSVHDTVELERAGIPTVLVTTTRFRPVAATLAAVTGLPEIRTLVVDHPIGGVSQETLHRRAEAACDELVGLFTGVSVPVAMGSPVPAEWQPGLVALQRLVEPDGATFEWVDDPSPDPGVLRLRLVIPDRDGAACVISRTLLESVATERMADHGVRRVVIDDPREASS